MNDYFIFSTNGGQEASPTCPHGLINGRPIYIYVCVCVCVKPPPHAPSFDPTQKKPKGVGVLGRGLKKEKKKQGAR